jgi:hypothetical protein
VRARLRSAESRISELETENAGLKRTIAQNSQSTAYQLSRRTPDEGSDDLEEITARLDRAGHNLKGSTE